MIKATLLLLAAWYWIPRLRRRSAAERHLLWAAALSAASALPILSALLPAWQPAWANGVLALLQAPLATVSQPPLAQTADVIVRANGLEGDGWTLGLALQFVWIAGTGAMLLMLITEAFKLTRLTWSAEPIDSGRWPRLAAEVAGFLRLRQSIRLLQSRQASVPMTWGFRRPRVLLPAGAGAWDDERARAVLMHELGHVRRGDWMVHVAAELVCAVYWFHPLFWIARRHLRRESEHAADDEVLRLGLEAGDYATHLLEIVRAAQTPLRAWSPTIAMGRAPQLERRFAALLAPFANRRAVTKRTVLATVVLAGAAVIPVAAIMSARGVAPDIEIRTANLPDITAGAAAPGLERAAPAVRAVRALGVDAAGEAGTGPEIVEYTTPPLYSDAARAQRIEGVVTVAARVEADGRIGGTRVVRGLGFGLDQNAMVALRQWRFRPGTRAGRAAAMDAEVDIEFSLRNESLNELIANDMATRVGPGITPPRAVRQFALWPRRPKIRGTVVLDVVLLENGQPRIIKILQSLDPALDESAVRNFQQWRFSPAMKNGRPVKVRMNAEVHFHG